MFIFLYFPNATHHHISPYIGKIAKNEHLVKRKMHFFHVFYTERKKMLAGSRKQQTLKLEKDPAFSHKNKPRSLAPLCGSEAS
jgi:hypothetical protein